MLQNSVRAFLFFEASCPVRLPNHTGPLGIKFPIGDQVLHRHGVVAPTQAISAVELMGMFELGWIDFYSQTRSLRHVQSPVADSKWVSRESLALLPDPMRVNRGHFSGRGRRYVGEHGQRYVKMVIRV